MKRFHGRGAAARIGLLLFFLLFSSVAWAASEAGSAAADKDKKAQAASPGPVATVNGKPLSGKDLNSAVNATRQQLAGRGMQPGMLSDEQIRTMALDQMIDIELLYQASQKEGIKVDKAEVDGNLVDFKKQFPSDEEFAEFKKRNELTEELMKEQLARKMSLEGLQAKLLNDFTAKISITDEAQHSFYDKNLEKMKEPEKVRASHILVKVEENADEAVKKAAMDKIKGIQKKLKDGGDFAKLAEENSDCPSKAQGGDLNFFAREQMVKPFSDAAFATPVGQTSDIVTTNFGYHLIKVTDKKAGRTVPFEEVQEKIKTFLTQQELDGMYQAYLKDLRDKAKIVRLEAEKK